MSLARRIDTKTYDDGQPMMIGDRLRTPGSKRDSVIVDLGIAGGRFCLVSYKPPSNGGSSPGRDARWLFPTTGMRLISRGSTEAALRAEAAG